MNDFSLCFFLGQNVRSNELAYGQSTTSQSVTRYSSRSSSWTLSSVLARSVHVGECNKWAHLGHFFSGQVEVEDFRVADDTFLRDRLGNDDKALYHFRISPRSSLSQMMDGEQGWIWSDD